MRVPCCLAALVILWTLARSTHAQGEASVDEKLAIDAFHQGDAAFDSGNFDAALEAYRRSLALLPSPNSRLLVARCLARLNRPSEALAEFEMTKNEAGQRAERDPRFIRARDAATEEAASMRELVGYVDIARNRLPASAVVSLDERVVLPASYDVQIPHDPGHVHVVIRAPGYEPYTDDITLSARTNALFPRVPLIVAREPRPIAQPKSPLPIIGWTSIAVGAASLVTSAVLATITQSRYDSLVTSCSARPCGESDVASGRTLATSTYITLGVGLGLAALGIVTVLASPKRRAPRLGLAGVSF